MRNHLVSELCWWICMVLRTDSLLPVYRLKYVSGWNTKEHKWKVFSVEGSRFKRCDFEEGFCDLIQSSETHFGWTRTTEVLGLKHDHINSTSGIRIRHLLAFTDLFWIHNPRLILYLFYSCLMHALPHFSLAFSTFPVAFTRQRKQNNSRPEQPCLSAQSDMPGDKILCLGNFGMQAEPSTTTWRWLVISFLHFLV